MNLLIGQVNWLKLVGGIFRLYLGVKTFVAPAAEQVTATGRKGLLGAYLSTLFFTITNPMTILSFIAIFAAAMPSDSQNSPLILGLASSLGPLFGGCRLASQLG